MIDVKISGLVGESRAFPWHTVDAVAPHLVWTGLILFLLLWIGRAQLQSLLGNVQKLNIAGVEVQFRKAFEEASEERAEKISGSNLDRVSRRLANCRSLTQGARILWVDDHPSNNRIEASILGNAGAVVEFVTSTSDALAALRGGRYDLVLSDNDRGNDPKAGEKFLAGLSESRGAPLGILYTGAVTGTPPRGAFGVTDRPDELIHLVLDALSRVRD